MGTEDARARGASPYVAGSLSVLLQIIVSGHVVLTKRDTRAAVAWVGLVWLVPVIGSVLYGVFGINRIQRHAAELREENRPVGPSHLLEPVPVRGKPLVETQGYLKALARIGDELTGWPLTHGNAVAPLLNGDAVFPTMIGAIDAASQSVVLSTYIFDRDRAGWMFADALAGAIRRGVEVRVLIDGAGSRYSWPSMVGALRGRGVRTARFLPTLAPWRAPFLNLRNHRKLLIVDDQVGFTGGMNIREGHALEWSPRRPVQDLHFRVEGPAVAHFMEAFAEDWAFSTKETLGGQRWFPTIEPRGDVTGRGILDGPDEDFEKLRWIILGAIASAKRSVRIATPYFLPDGGLITSLNVAAMRGVEVDILLPVKNNLPLVKWASTFQLTRVLRRGCRVFYSPPPFDHTKLMIVDGVWTLFGSANWDPRSLRLNFEFNVECYDEQLGQQLEELFLERQRAAREVTAAELDQRSLPAKLRDGLARLLSPYL